MLIRLLACVVAILSVSCVIFANPDFVLGNTIGRHDARFSFGGARDFEKRCGYNASWHAGDVRVQYGCAHSDLEAKNIWRQNLRVLARVFQAEDDYQCIPFTSALSQFRYTGTLEDRAKLRAEIESFADLMLAAAETARRTHRYISDVGVRTFFWEKVYLWSAAVIAGPVVGNLPSDKQEAQNDGWSVFLVNAVYVVTGIVKDQYWFSKHEIDKCDEHDVYGAVAELTWL